MHCITWLKIQAVETLLELFECDSMLNVLFGICLALRGWVGEDKRHWWLYTEDHPSTVENQSANMEKNNLAAEIEFMEELLEPIKERTVHIGDRVSDFWDCPFQLFFGNVIVSTFNIS